MSTDITLDSEAADVTNEWIFKPQSGKAAVDTATRGIALTAPADVLVTRRDPHAGGCLMTGYTACWLPAGEARAANPSLSEALMPFYVKCEALRHRFFNNRINSC